MHRRRGPWAYSHNIIRFPYKWNIGPCDILLPLKIKERLFPMEEG